MLDSGYGMVRKEWESMPDDLIVKFTSGHEHFSKYHAGWWCDPCPDESCPLPVYSDNKIKVGRKAGYLIWHGIIVEGKPDKTEDGRFITIPCVSDSCPHTAEEKCLVSERK